MTSKTASIRIIWAVLTGVAYGITVRIAFEWKTLHPILQIVSTAFLVVCPFSVGAIAVLRSAGQEEISLSKQVNVASFAMLLFIVAMFLTLLEGLICLVLVGPVFFVAAILGGIVAGSLHNYKMASKATVPAFALLPLLLAPLENLQPIESNAQSVTNTIHVAAPPEQVFEKLGSVREIKSSELGFSFVHLIGLPKPLSAEMNCEHAGCARTSRWEKNVWFQEVITEWQAPQSMHYRFVIPKGGIPREALDRHVEVGGEYFDLIDGGYDLQRATDGGTMLSLTTRFVNKSQLKLYGNLWGRMVLKDFHGSILNLIKKRAENT
jgi:hypothetical protein